MEYYSDLWRGRAKEACGVDLFVFCNIHINLKDIEHILAIAPFIKPAYHNGESICWL
jgi:hypothetical protein